MESVQKQLEELGLSQNEVKAYLAALELGPATAQQIAAKAAVVRPTAYVAIGGLVKRGLMSSHTRGKKQYFQAERPGQLMRMVDEEKKKLAERESKLKSLLPGLEAMIAMAGEKPEVKYYEGWDGLEIMREALLGSGVKSFDVIRHASVAVASYNKLPAAKSFNYGLELTKRGITERQIIVSKTSAVKSWKPLFNNAKVKSKLLIGKDLGFSGEIAIFGDYITLISYQDKPYGCLLKSKDISELQRVMFEAIWQSPKLKSLREK